MTMQINSPASIFKIIIGCMTIFGAIGFTGGIINAFYTGIVRFDFIWITVGSMLFGMVVLGAMKK